MSERIKILYIDDDELNLTAFVRLFRRSYDITTASSALQGLESLKNDSFHVILVDQRMPKTTGSEFLKEIADQYPESIRVLVTAYSDLSAVISAVNEGKIYKYISKPYKKEEMAKVMEDAYQVHCLRAAQNHDSKTYKSAFLNCTDSIFLLSKERKVIDVNDSCLALLSTSREAIINEDVHSIFEKLSIKRDVISALEENEVMDDFEISFTTYDRIEHQCLLSLKKICYDRDKSIGFQGTIKNISNYKSSLMDSMRSLIAYKEFDRESVVKVIHESSAQNLTGIHFLLTEIEKTAEGSDKEKLAEVKSTLTDTIEELRNLCFSILPKSLEFGLSGALEDLTSRIEVAYQTKCHLVVEDDLVDSSKDFKLMIFRTIQSILKGLKKEGSEFTIEITRDDYCLYSEVTGTVLEGNDQLISRVKTEVDCYSGNITLEPAMNNQTCYRMIFPMHSIEGNVN